MEQKRSNLFGFQFPVKPEEKTPPKEEVKTLVGWEFGFSADCKTVADIRTKKKSRKH